MPKKQTKKIGEGFTEKNPIDNPEAFKKVAEGVKNIRGQLHNYREFNERGKKSVGYESAEHEKNVELAKEALMTVAVQVEEYYKMFKLSLPESHQIIAPMMLEKYINAEKGIFKKKKPKEFEQLEQLMKGFYIGAEEVEDKNAEV